MQAQHEAEHLRLRAELARATQRWHEAEEKLRGRAPTALELDYRARIEGLTAQLTLAKKGVNSAMREALNVMRGGEGSSEVTDDDLAAALIEEAASLHEAYGVAYDEGHVAGFDEGQTAGRSAGAAVLAVVEQRLAESESRVITLTAQRDAAVRAHEAQAVREVQSARTRTWVALREAQMVDLERGWAEKLQACNRDLDLAARELESLRGALLAAEQQAEHDRHQAQRAAAENVRLREAWQHTKMSRMPIEALAAAAAALDRLIDGTGAPAPLDELQSLRACRDQMVRVLRCRNREDVPPIGIGG